jgi:Predicted metal-binding integral membrane protein (DUF2182)
MFRVFVCLPFRRLFRSEAQWVYINSIFSVPKGFAPSFANLPTVKINSKIIQKYKKIRFVNFYGPDSDTDCREDGGHLLLLRLLPMMVGTSPWLGSLLLIAARIYQWTPLKQPCLRHCQTPLQFLLTCWQDGTAGAFLMGLRHGTYKLSEPRIGREQRQELAIAATQIQNPRHATRWLEDLHPTQRPH